MPAPSPSQIESPTKGFLNAAGLQGEDVPGLAAAIANTTGQALTMFLSQAMTMPGIPVAADPISGSGASAGPGKLMPPPAGGPGASQLEGLASGQCQAQPYQADGQQHRQVAGPRFVVRPTERQFGAAPVEQPRRDHGDEHPEPDMDAPGQLDPTGIGGICSRILGVFTDGPVGGDVSVLCH